MALARVIPVLLLRDGGLVKTVRFKDARYIGDPINAVRILNDKEVDELIFLDIGASTSGVGPSFALLEEIASEAFMPFGYGGGIKTTDDIRRLLALGTEKVVINSAAISNPRLVSDAAKLAGSSSVVVAMDVKKRLLGEYEVRSESRRNSRIDPAKHASEMADRGAGEIIVQSIDRDGVMAGYDLSLIRRVAEAVSVPVVALGGAGTMEDFTKAIEAGASAVAAGSMFVFRGKHKAVLITYPEPEAIREAFR